MGVTRAEPATPRGRRRGAAGGPATAGAAEHLPIAVAVVVALLGIAALMAPPLSNDAWAFNGFRSVSLGARLRVLAVAVLAWALARDRRARALPWLAIAVTLGALLAWPWRERIHVLGDTDFRIRSIGAVHANVFGITTADWARGLHAQPLDILINLLGPLGLHASGAGVLTAIQVTSFVLSLVFFAGAWRLARALTPREDTRTAAFVALLASGLLEAFAGYAESAGLLLVTGVWWWSLIGAPLRDRRQAIVLSIAWLMVALAHRQGLFLAVPMLLRGTRLASSGDDPAARRTLLLLVPAVLLVAIGLPWMLSGAPPFGQDSADLIAVVSGWARGRRVPAPMDLVNLIALVSPLAIVALAGRAARGVPATPVAAARASAPVAALALFTALVLVPAVLTVATGPHELGAHRDWDVGVLLGLSLTVASIAALERLGEPGRRATLVAAAPVLALVAGGWVAVNADAKASEARAVQLTEQRFGFEDEARSALETFLGQRAMNRRDAKTAYPHFERAYDAAPNPRLLLVAAEARAAAGDLAGARADLARARATGGLNAHNQESARIIESMLDAVDPAKRDTSRVTPP